MSTSNVSNGSVSWAIKESFNAYIEGLPDGEIQLLGDAQLVDGAYLFPSVSSGDGGLLFSGGVHFTGFAGMLDVRLVDPMIEDHDIKSTGPVLSVLVGPASIAARVVIAEIPDVDANTLGTVGSWSATPTLTFEGVRVFGDVYQVGAELAPLIVTGPVV